MDFVAIYAVAAGGILGVLFLIRAASSLVGLLNIISVMISTHLTYPYIINRHRLFGPWTRANILLFFMYAVINGFFVVYRTQSALELGRRAGSLSLVNTAFLILAPHLSFLADILGISLQTCRRIHRVIGYAISCLLAFHIIISILVQQEKFLLDNKRNLFALIAAVSLVMIIVLCLPFLRRFAYEVFLRTHQVLVAVYIYSTWRHLPSSSIFPRIYIYVPLAILLVLTGSYGLVFLYRNGVLPPRPYPRASVASVKGEPLNDDNQEGRPLKICVVLPRPLDVKAGQYVNLWMPTVSLSSWTQTHPFMVTSWSPRKQDVLELFVQTRRGLTEKLRVRADLQGLASFIAFVGGPYGISEPVSQYESVLVIASDFGLAGVISYIKQLLYGYNTSTSRIRRVHFVWQVQSLDLALAAEPLLNSLLADDVLDGGYILEMSFYMESKTGLENKKPFGEHGRAIIYNAAPDYEKIVSKEASGGYITRLATQEKGGKLLVMVSGPGGLRDNLRRTVRRYLDQKIRLHEVEFQPN